MWGEGAKSTATQEHRLKSVLPRVRLAQDHDEDRFATASPLKSELQDMTGIKASATFKRKAKRKARFGFWRHCGRRRRRGGLYSGLACR